jgi:hypothetical protein
LTGAGEGGGTGFNGAFEQLKINEIDPITIDIEKIFLMIML